MLLKNADFVLMTFGMSVYYCSNAIFARINHVPENLRRNINFMPQSMNSLCFNCDWNSCPQNFFKLEAAELSGISTNEITLCWAIRTRLVGTFPLSKSKPLALISFSIIKNITSLHNLQQFFYVIYLVVCSQ